MAKYCKKPVEIEAIQWNGANETEIKKFIGESAKFTVVSDTAWEVNTAKPITKLEIETLEGTMTAQIGDFIIRGVDGEFYPCKPDIFEKTYEVIPE